VFLLVLLLSFSPGFFHPVKGQSDVSILYVSPLNPSLPPPTVGGSYTVAVKMYLAASDGIGGFDIILRTDRYNESYTPTILDPVSIQPGNVFQGSQNLTGADCVDGYGQGCDPAHGDGSGAVHLAVVVFGSSVPGGQTVTLFSVTYNVVSTGSTEFEFTNDNVTYSPFVQNYGPNTMTLLHLDYGAVFSNQGLTSFFNISPPILVVGVPAVFDATGSFSPKGAVTGYRWDFGDGASSIAGPTASHVYDRTGSYSVTLGVTNGTVWSGVVRTVRVSSGLGALRIYPVPLTGSSQIFQGSVTVTLYNMTASGTPLVGTRSKPSTVAWVIFSGLTAGNYRIDLSGAGVTPMSKQETVTAGWTSSDTIYVPVTLPGPPSILPLVIFLSLVLGGTGLGSVIIFRRKRILKNPKRPKSSVAHR
jgi:PKD repeat protein